MAYKCIQGHFCSKKDAGRRCPQCSSIGGASGVPTAQDDAVIGVSPTGDVPSAVSTAGYEATAQVFHAMGIQGPTWGAQWTPDSPLGAGGRYLGSIGSQEGRGGYGNPSIPETWETKSRRVFEEVEAETQSLLEEVKEGRFAEGSAYAERERWRAITRDRSGRIMVTDDESATIYADVLCRQDPVAAAKAVSVSAHAGQRDKLGVPYPYHPQGVHDLLVASKEYDELTTQQKQDAEAAAYLHDVVEDTDLTLEDLRRIGFSEGTITAVDALTVREEEKEDKSKYFARICAPETGPVPRALKLADLSHNNLPCRRASLPGAPGVPLKADDPKGGDMYGRLGKKYAKAYQALDAEIPDHLKQFAA